MKKTNIQEQVYLQLRDNIYSQTWLPGDKIPSENELANIFNVSRVSIRGALQKLIAQGFLDSRQGEGTFVCELTMNTVIDTLVPFITLSQRNILQVLEYRKMIELGITNLIIENRTDSDIKYLGKNVKLMKQVKDDYIKAADLDLQFHLYLSKMSKNDLVIRINSIIFDIYKSVMHEVKAKVGMEAGDVFHQAIVESLKNGNRRAFKKSVQEHLDWTIQQIRKLETGQ